MAKIDFPKGIESVEGLPKTARHLTNCFNDGNGSLVQRPGITQLATTSKVARGQFKWNDALYQVVSQSLIKITNLATGAFSVIGTVAGSDDIRVAIGFVNAVIVVKNGAIYTLDTSDVLVDISGNANMVSCVDVCHINSRFVYIPASGDPAFFSDVGAAGTIDALSFFDAEELPDKNTTCFIIKSTLYIGGADSFELFRDTGAVPNPFTRVTGARIQNGFIGGLLQYADTYLFVGNEIDQDSGIYAIGSGKAEKISNHAVDKILTDHTPTELSQAIASRFKWRGYDIATFTLRGASLGFIGGNWFELETFIGGISRNWGGGFITEINNKYYTAKDDKIGVLADVNTDYGNPLTRDILVAFTQEDGEYITCQSVSLGLSQGYNANAGSVAIQLSRDGVTFGDPLYRDVGVLGEYNSRLTWRYAGGLGTYENFVAIRITTTENINFSCDSLSVILS